MINPRRFEELHFGWRLVIDTVKLAGEYLGGVRGTATISTD